MTSKDRDDKFIGILSLDTAFPRILGDAGNPDSYDMPTKVEVVTGVGSTDIVCNTKLDHEIVEKFCLAAKKLEGEGAVGIVSTCGFLMSAQNQIAPAVDIPVMVSSLSLYASVCSALKTGRKVGIMTASQKNLGNLALQSAGIIATDVDIIGMEDCSEFRALFLVPKEEQKSEIDIDEIEKTVVEKAKLLINRSPEIGAIILECGNLPPYADAIERAVGRPVYTILDAAKMFWTAHKPSR